MSRFNDYKVLNRANDRVVREGRVDLAAPRLGPLVPKDNLVKVFNRAVAEDLVQDNQALLANLLVDSQAHGLNK